MLGLEPELQYGRHPIAVERPLKKHQVGKKTKRQAMDDIEATFPPSECSFDAERDQGNVTTSLIILSPSRVTHRHRRQQLDNASSRGASSHISHADVVRSGRLRVSPDNTVAAAGTTLLTRMPRSQMERMVANTCARYGLHRPRRGAWKQW